MLVVSALIAFKKKQIIWRWTKSFSEANSEQNANWHKIINKLEINVHGSHSSSLSLSHSHVCLFTSFSSPILRMCNLLCVPLSKHLLNMRVEGFRHIARAPDKFRMRMQPVNHSIILQWELAQNPCYGEVVGILRWEHSNPNQGNNNTFFKKTNEKQRKKAKVV